MRVWWALMVCCLVPSMSLGTLYARDRAATPGHAENGFAAVNAQVLDRATIKSLLGGELDPMFTVLSVTLSPKKGEIAVQLDDFVLLTHHDGQRSRPFAASEIAGRADMTVVATSTGTIGAERNAPVWTGVPGAGVGMPSNGQIGGTGAGGSMTTAKVNQAPIGKQDPMYNVLKAKILAEQRIKAPSSGLLIFNLGKQKLHDLELIYTTSEGPLKVAFR